jgi:hypothetical protein
MGLCAVLALGLTYTWDGGGGANIRWDYCPNWDLEDMTPCWPSQTTDTAVIPGLASHPDPWNVNLVTTTIHNATIGWSVNFGPADPNAVLHLTELQIQSPSDVEVTIPSGAQITTAP